MADQMVKAIRRTFRSSGEITANVFDATQKVRVLLAHRLDTGRPESQGVQVDVVQIQAAIAQNSHRHRAVGVEIDAVREAAGLDVDEDSYGAGSGGEVECCRGRFAAAPGGRPQINTECFGSKTQIAGREIINFAAFLSGQAAPLNRVLPAGELIDVLVAEAQAVLGLA